MVIQCSCCGQYYSPKHIVVYKGKENFYIPHAIRIFGLFKSPSEIRAKLDRSELTDYLYILPGDITYEVVNDPEKWWMVGSLPFGWRKERSRFGDYYWLDNRV